MTDRCTKRLAEKPHLRLALCRIPTLKKDRSVRVVRLGHGVEQVVRANRLSSTRTTPRSLSVNSGRSRSICYHTTRTRSNPRSYYRRA